MSPRQGIGVGIAGMGAALPTTVRDNSYWRELVSEHQAHTERDPVAAITTRIDASRANVDPEFAEHFSRYAADPFRGAVERRVVEPVQTSSDLEVEAAAEALRDAGLGPADVDLVVTFSQVPDFPCPGNHALVAHRLGVPAAAASMTVGADCASFVPGLKVASRLIASGEHQIALVVQGCTATQVVDPKRHASTAVGDGAVAVVIRRVEAGKGYIGTVQLSRGEYHGVVRVAPQHEAQLPWYRGDLHGAPLVFQSMDAEGGAAAGGRAVSLCREACSMLLDQCGYTASDVDFLVISQPTIWYPLACADTLGIPRDRTLSTFAEYGHLMPASAPINLYSARRAGSIQSGDLVLLYTPGAGFIQAAALMRWAY